MFSLAINFCKVKLLRVLFFVMLYTHDTIFILSVALGFLSMCTLHIGLKTMKYR